MTRMLPSTLLAMCLLLGSGTLPVHAQREPSVRIEAADRMPLGAGSVAIIVRVPHGPTQPLLLTVSTAGDHPALQVMRARFLRADATLDAQGELRFEVPVMAARAGQTELRAQLSTYACDPHCAPIRASATRMLSVAP